MFKFPKTRRLRGAAEFDRVFVNPRRLVNRHIAVFCCENDLGYPRMGLSVPKRNIKSAHLRNLFKRVARESFRHTQTKLGGMDIVIVAYRGVGDYKSTELHQHLDDLWAKLISKCEKH